MKDDMTDQELKRIFVAMRKDDEASALDFERLTRNAPIPQRHVHGVMRLAALLAISAIGVGTLMFLSPRQNPSNVAQGDVSDEVSLEGWSSLSSWEAPTDNIFILSDNGTTGAFSTSTDSLLDFSEPQTATLNDKEEI